MRSCPTPYLVNATDAAHLGCKPPIMREVPSGSQTTTTSACSFSCSWMAAHSCSMYGSPVAGLPAARLLLIAFRASGTSFWGAMSRTSCKVHSSYPQRTLRRYSPPRAPVHESSALPFYVTVQKVCRRRAFDLSETFRMPHRHIKSADDNILNLSIGSVAAYELTS